MSQQTEIRPYSEERSLAISSEKERIDSLVLLNDDQKYLITDSVKFLAVPYLPMSYDFINKYVLAPVEYPTEESKLVQALTELSVRVQNLANRNYEYQKLLLEIEELEEDINEVSGDKSISEVRANIKIKKLRLEIANKNYLVGQARIVVSQVFEEFKNWKLTVEGCLKRMNRDSLDGIDWSKVKTAELDLKTKLWLDLNSKGLAELTPSRIQAILSNPEALNPKS